jgi:2-polyprenyl-6-methoxyphenol hydroxylase-like FAD-dependent oxidoreductase
MMLGFLLARAGIDVIVLEKHADFLRDFRGDTIHPSTLELMAELGLLDEFLKLSHTELRTLRARFGALEFSFVDFSHIPTRCKFIAMMPQWDFLNFLAEQGKRFPQFDLRMRAEAIGLIEEGGVITGVRARMPDQEIEIRADAVIGCDGRTSILRKLAGFQSDDLGAPMDVLWFRLPRKSSDPDETMAQFQAGRIFVLIDRGDYWQCAYVIPKGSIDDIHRGGLDAFRDSISGSVPMFAGRMSEIADWDHVKLLTVTVDRLRTWHRQGLLCIGDAAHAMSPIGGVGINLAVQDAVAAANILWQPLAERKLTNAHFAEVQKRREFPTRVTQAIQLTLQKRVIGRALESAGEFKPPLAMRWMARFPFLRRLPARLLGVGVRPEHVRTPPLPAS